MEDFRCESFFQFIRTKPVGLFRIILIGAFFILVTIFLTSFRLSLDAFWVYSAFILICLSAQGLFLYSIAYRMYSYGKKAFLDLKHKNVTILNDVGVFVRGFDLMSKPSFFSIDISKPIYQFDKADVIIGGTSLVLLGKVKEWGSIYYGSPVEIFKSEKLTTVASAKLLHWTEQKGRIVMEIKDEFYAKPFKIEFKDHVDQIKLWLTVCL